MLTRSRANILLAIRSDAPAAPAAALPAATLPDVCVTMAQWLGVPGRESWGRPINALV